MSLETDPNGSAIKGANALARAVPVRLVRRGRAEVEAPAVRASTTTATSGRCSATRSHLAVDARRPEREPLTHRQHDALIVWDDEGRRQAEVADQEDFPGCSSTRLARRRDALQRRPAGVRGRRRDARRSAPRRRRSTPRSTATPTAAASPRPQYTKAFSGLPSDALLRAFGNLGTCSHSPGPRKARQVPWVAAFRGYADDDQGELVRPHVQLPRSTPPARPLTEAQLPFAPGTPPPTLAGTLPITFGIHDPAQIVQFVESAEQIDQPGQLRDVPEAPGRDPRQDRCRSQQPAQAARPAT